MKDKNQRPTVSLPSLEIVSTEPLRGYFFVYIIPICIVFLTYKQKLPPFSFINGQMIVVLLNMMMMIVAITIPPPGKLYLSAWVISN